MKSKRLRLAASVVGITGFLSSVFLWTLFAVNPLVNVKSSKSADNTLPQDTNVSGFHAESIVR